MQGLRLGDQGQETEGCIAKAGTDEKETLIICLTQSRVSNLEKDLVRNKQ